MVRKKKIVDAPVDETTDGSDSAEPELNEPELDFVPESDEPPLFGGIETKSLVEEPPVAFPNITTLPVKVSAVEPAQDNTRFELAEGNIKEESPVYKIGEKFLFNRIFGYEKSLIHAGAMYEVTSVNNYGLQASLKKVRGTGPNRIKIGFPHPFMYRC